MDRRLLGFPPKNASFKPTFPVWVTHARRIIVIGGGDAVADPVCDPTFSSWGVWAL